MSEIRIADLFAGIGGIRMGMVQALGDAAHVVYSSEWNKYSVQTYEANWHDENPVAGDITKVDEHDVPDIDLLLAGFPCQPFSIAGVSKKQSMGRPTGFEDKTQGTLFFDVARIIKAKQPKAFLLENVKNLLSHDRGRTFKTIYSVLTEDLGYHVTYKLIDAAGFVPQHRERTYIVGFREENGFTFDDVKPIAHGNVGSILLPASQVPDKYVLSDKLWTYLQNYKKKHEAAGNGFGYGMVDAATDHTRTLSARYGKDGSEIHERLRKNRRLHRPGRGQETVGRRYRRQQQQPARVRRQRRAQKTARHRRGPQSIPRARHTHRAHVPERR